MTTKFALSRDINGYNGFGLKFSDDKFGVQLAAGVAQSITVPTQAAKYIAIFAYQPGGNVYVALNDTAAVYTGTAASVNSEFNPVAREVSSGDTLSLITDDAQARVGVTFYAL